ncbi:MAG: PQQ-binding-like beta-propeller repeat protein [Myxococcota bacterium]|nr:PQQ-binding-like beta-propeller repeat protein [Myxococcota bacterium]
MKLRAGLSLLCGLSVLAGCRTVPLDGSALAQGSPAQADLWDIDWRVQLVSPGLLEYAPRELATPAIDPDTRRVYALTRDRMVRAISPDGKLEWEFETRGPFNAGAAVHEGTLYVPGADGFLYALKARTGELLWKYDAKEELATTPVIEGDLVLVASMTDTLFAVNRSSGEWVWQYRRDTPAGFTIRGASAPVVGGGRAYVGFSDGFFVALDLKDGTLEWERKLGTGTEFIDVDTTAVLDEAAGRVYVASYQDGLFALEAQGGEVQWTTSASGINHLVVDAGTVFATGDAQVAAFNGETGQRLWSKVLKNRAGRRPVLARGMLLVPQDNLLLFLNPRSGKEQVSWDPGDGVSAAPLVVGSHLYVLSNLGFLYSMYLQPLGRG